MNICFILKFEIMALFKSFLLGDVRKSVANVTMYAGANGYSIARGKRNTVRNPRTPAQLTQRAKLKALEEASRYFAPAAALGFPGRKGGNTFYNAFVSSNMAAVTVDENYEPTIDFEKLKCAAGSLQNGKVTITVDEENGKVMVSQEAQTRWNTVANPTDVLHVVIYEKTKKEMIVEACRNRKEAGSTSIAMDEGWSKENLVFYAFMLSKDKRKASDSMVIRPE